MSCLHPNRSILQPLFSVPLTVASIIKGLGPRGHITPTLKQLTGFPSMPVSHSKSPSSCRLNVNRPTKYSRLLWLRLVAVVELVCFSPRVSHLHVHVFWNRTFTSYMSSMVTPCSASMQVQRTPIIHAEASIRSQ